MRLLLLLETLEGRCYCIIQSCTLRVPSAPAQSPPPTAGPLLVKAGVWTLVEQLHASGRSKLYTGWPPTAQQVGSEQARLGSRRAAGPGMQASGCMATGGSKG